MNGLMRVGRPPSRLLRQRANILGLIDQPVSELSQWQDLPADKRRRQRLLRSLQPDPITTKSFSKYLSRLHVIISCLSLCVRRPMMIIPSPSVVGKPFLAEFSAAHAQALDVDQAWTYWTSGVAQAMLLPFCKT